MSRKTTLTVRLSGPLSDFVAEKVSAHGAFEMSANISGINSQR